MQQKPHNLALVLSGGGARGAYEAGVVHYIRTMLPKEIATKRGFDILCGSSVGAINTTFLAATAHDLTHQGNRLHELWKNIRQANVYRRDVASMASLIARSMSGITRNVFRRFQDSDVEPVRRKFFSGLLNTTPLANFLKKHVPWQQISVNIANGLVKAVSLTATNVYTGRLELFVEKHADVPYTGHYVFNDTKLEAGHVMASAALPLLFPSVRLGSQYYVDGGLRLNTPMSPAIQLGADRLVTIGLHHISERPEEQDVVNTFDGLLKLTPPSIGLMLGKILSTIFLDRLDYDMEQMTRINRIIEWGEGRFGADYITQINNYLQEQNIRGDIANRGLKKLKAMRISPSRDIREVFGECIGTHHDFTDGMTGFEKFFLKVLDVDFHSGKDFLSFIMFHPTYLEKLLELGFEDARKQHDELVAFMMGD